MPRFRHSFPYTRYLLGKVTRGAELPIWTLTAYMIPADYYTSVDMVTLLLLLVRTRNTIEFRTIIILLQEPFLSL